jgi:hypothetical protein
VLALSPRHEVVRRCRLLWGVHPQLDIEPLNTLDLRSTPSSDLRGELRQ